MVGNRKTGLRYGEVEAILASILRVEPDGEKAFRARLRHLRNIGVPMGITEPGKGAVIRFTRTQVFEMLLCLGLQKFGVTPSEARDLVRSIMKEWDKTKSAIQLSSNDDRQQYKLDGEDTRILILSSFQGKLEFLLQDASVNPDYPFYTAIDLSVCERLLDRAILNTLT
jgi:hypothetical protein